MTAGIPGVDNFRDVGGLPAGEARTRGGVLFRSGNLARLQDDGRRELARFGIRRIIDLRSDDEARSQPSRIEGLALTTQRVPLYLGSVASLFEEDLSLAEMYRRILDDSADMVVDVVRGIIADPPVLVHCAVGKDRTGVVVAITLAAAGVDRDAIVADYALTERAFSPEHIRMVQTWLNRRHPGAVNAVELATRAPAAVMHDVLGEVDRRHGSAGEYLTAQGLADDELTELRRILLTDEG